MILDSAIVISSIMVVIKQITSSKILLYSILLTIAGFLQFENEFSPIEKKIDIKNNQLIFNISVKKIEFYRLELKYSVQKEDIKKTKLRIFINQVKVKNLELIGNEKGDKRIRFSILPHFFRIGKNEVKLISDTPHSNVIYESFKWYNYSGSSPNFPVGYLVSDDYLRTLEKTSSAFNKIVSFFVIFISVFFSILIYFILLNGLFYGDFKKCITNNTRFFLLPTLFFLATLIYSYISEKK